MDSKANNRYDCDPWLYPKQTLGERVWQILPRINPCYPHWSVRYWKWQFSSLMYLSERVILQFANGKFSQMVLQIPLCLTIVYLNSSLFPLDSIGPFDPSQYTSSLLTKGVPGCRSTARARPDRHHFVSCFRVMFLAFFYPYYTGSFGQSYGYNML